MISRTLTTLNLTENQVYRLDNYLLEATFRDVWTLMVITESGHHLPREHGALVAYELRADGLWDTIYDCKTRRLFGWKRWSFAFGKPKKIEVGELTYVAENRFTLRATLQEQEVDQKFRAIMSTMEW